MTYYACDGDHFILLLILDLWTSHIPRLSWIWKTSRRAHNHAAGIVFKLWKTNYDTPLGTPLATICNMISRRWHWAVVLVVLPGHTCLSSCCLTSFVPFFSLLVLPTLLFSPHHLKLCPLLFEQLCSKIPSLASKCKSIINRNILSEPVHLFGYLSSSIHFIHICQGVIRMLLLVFVVWFTFGL